MRKKICFLVSSLGGGGAEKGLVNLINHLDPAKYELHLCVDAPLFDRAKELRVPVQMHLFCGRGRLAMGKKSMWGGKNIGYRAQLTMHSDILRRLHGIPACDVFFLFMDSPNVAMLVDKNQKYISLLGITTDYEKNFLDFLNPNDTQAIKRHITLSSKCDWIVNTADHMRQSYEKATGLTQNVTRVYNIDNYVELSQKALMIADKIIKKNFTIVAVGRLNEWKGYPRLLNVCERLNHDGLDYSLWILGEGSQRKQLERQIQERNLFNVLLMGYYDNPYPYIKAADLYVSSSYLEGLSLAAKEAMLLGLPSVVTNCSGMHEIFGENSEYGLITENSDEALYKGLYRMLTDRPLYDYYQKKVKERRAFFSVDASLKEYEALFETTRH